VRIRAHMQGHPRTKNENQIAQITLAREQVDSLTTFRAHCSRWHGLLNISDRELCVEEMLVRAHRRYEVH
jgi:hypothetical protein